MSYIYIYDYMYDYNIYIYIYIITIKTNGVFITRHGFDPDLLNSTVQKMIREEAGLQRGKRTEQKGFGRFSRQGFNVFHGYLKYLIVIF